MIIGSSRFHNAAFFNSSNFLISTLYGYKHDVYQFLNLRQVNKDLAKENAFLRKLLNEDRVEVFYMDTTVVTYHDTIRQYDFVPALVINNSTRSANNFLTLDRGKNDGIEPGMGVIGTRGIVGRIKAVSKRYSTAYSLLHTEMFVSSTINRLNQNCSVKWRGIDPQRVDLLYVPRHVNIQIGDTISTSGFSTVFPQGIPIGTIESFDIKENQTFYDIKVRLSNDFNSQTHVYVVKNYFAVEKDSLEQVNE